MPELSGLASYAIFFASLVAVYGVLVLGLNVQWGMAGLLNIGVAGFFGLGAYGTGILTAAPNPGHLGGYGLPIPVGIAGAMALAALAALLIGLVTMRLRTDYLAIATIAAAEIIRVTFQNAAGLGGGAKGLGAIPRPFAELGTGAQELAFAGLVLAVLGVVYLLIERAHRAPWGRVQLAIRDSEDAARAAGKSVGHFRLQAFVLGAALMGLAGALYSHFYGFVSPEALKPTLATFLIWVMLIAGGSGNNRGALLGALLIWSLWSATGLLANLLPPDHASRIGAMQQLLVGLLLVGVLLVRPQGLVPETRPTPPPPRRAPPQRAAQRPAPEISAPEISAPADPRPESSNP